MIRKYLITAMCAFAFAPLCAQETYETARIIDKELNGTARYVGMGGAMDALGADLSTIRTNPAGMGLFRHSKAGLSFGVMNQEDAHKFADGKPTHFTFDQAGFVFALHSGEKSFINFGFNYTKSKDFNYILSAASGLNGASQNKLSYLKGKEGVFEIPSLSNGRPQLNDYNEVVSPDETFNQLDYLYFNTLIYNQNLPVDQQYGFYDADGYMMNRSNRGYIGTYDFNVSGNINDRVYLGATVGIHSVHYKGYSEYQEHFVPNMDNVGNSMLYDARKITGTGVDFRVGMIVRPFEYSPFRIGLHIGSPIYYDLTTTNETRLSYTNFDSYGSIGESYDFNMRTPWNFGISLGHTIGNYLALGATYEYDDYSDTKIKINNGMYYDPFMGDYYNDDVNDKPMNSHLNRTLKGVSTLKLGAEYKIDKSLAVRVGYNYVSPMYSKHGFKDGTVWSPGSYYASATDYTNWGATNRITCGFGYRIDKFSLDLAYQYSKKSGEFYPFMEYFADDANSDLNNICGYQKVENARHQVLLSIGYNF